MHTQHTEIILEDSLELSGELEEELEREAKALGIRYEDYLSLLDLAGVTY